MDVFHFRKLEDPGPMNAVLTIGNFDGVHLGHQQLIRQVVHEAHQMGVKSALMTFAPHPQAVLRGEPVPIISTLPLRLRLFEELGLDSAYLVPFTREFSRKSPEEFVREYLLTYFRVRKLIIGFDFHFGRDREGSSEVLRRMSAEHDFRFEVYPEISLDGEKVSSTAIRQALQAGDFARAQYFLGRPYSVLEQVVRGDQRGRQLGFPTLNQTPGEPLPLAHGVYAVRATLGNGKLGGDDPDCVQCGGVANYGIRPTFGGRQPVLETHLFDFDREVYGEMVEVIPLRKLRDERRFENIEALRSQITRDESAARAALAETTKR